MPSSTGVVQDAGVPLRPSISTMHIRHEPNGCRESVAQSFGIAQPASPAARITEVPSGTVWVSPSMVTLTMTSDSDFGVPKSGSPMPERIGMVPRGSERIVIT